MKRFMTQMVAVLAVFLSTGYFCLAQDVPSEAPADTSALEAVEVDLDASEAQMTEKVENDGITMSGIILLVDEFKNIVPLNNGQLMLMEQSTDHFDSLNTDKNGGYSFSNINAGNYIIFGEFIFKNIDGVKTTYAGYHKFSIDGNNENIHCDFLLTHDQLIPLTRDAEDFIDRPYSDFNKILEQPTNVPNTPAANPVNNSLTGVNGYTNTGYGVSGGYGMVGSGGGLGMLGAIGGLAAAVAIVAADDDSPVPVSPYKSKGSSSISESN